jgi:hypothetical protein
MEFLTGLVNSHTEVGGDVLQIGPTTWAIYGSISVDGDVLVAEYDSFEEATAVLLQIASDTLSDPRARREEFDAVDPTITLSAMRDRVSLSTCSSRPATLPAYFLGRDSATWRAALHPRPRPTESR